MDWVAAKSYYIGYNSINRFLSIVFIHNYLLTWSIGLIFSIIPLLLFLFAPSSLHTTRTTHFLIICIVCLSNMFCLYNQVYMITGSGEPNLSYHTCRFIVYISTFAKPIGIYLTLLFSIERLFTKILVKFFLKINNYRQLFQRLYTLLVFFGIILIFSIRLYEVLTLIPKKHSIIPQSSSSTNDNDQLADITDITNNSTDRNITFKYCFNTMNIDTYAKILSFYTIQYWFEYTILILNILILLIIILHQCCLSRNHQQHLLIRLSINTKFYFSLSLSVIISELILLFFHFIVDDINNNNTNVQFISLQFMLFIFNFRCILLPLIIFIIICEPLKEFFYELFILRPYLENIDENDIINTNDNRIEPFSSSQQTTSNRIQQKIRRTFTKHNNNNNNEHFANDESQADL